MGLQLDASRSPQPYLASMASVSVGCPNIPLVVQPRPDVGGSGATFLDANDIELGRLELFLEDSNFAHELRSGDLHASGYLLAWSQRADVGRGDRVVQRAFAR